MKTSCWCKKASGHLTIESWMSIACWDVLGAFFRPNSICRNLNSPWSDLKVFCPCPGRWFPFFNVQSCRLTSKVCMLHLSSPGIRPFARLGRCPWMSPLLAFCSNYSSVVIRISSKQIRLAMPTKSAGSITFMQITLSTSIFSSSRAFDPVR